LKDKVLFTGIYKQLFSIERNNPTMKRNTQLFLLLLLSLASCRYRSDGSSNTSRPVKPNIVLFFVDDLGWADLGFRNSTFETPNIDKLSVAGINFEQAYAPCPTCSPSRGTLLTGKHPARLKLVRHIPGNDDGSEFNYLDSDPAQFPSRNWLPLEHTTYAEALRKQGYYNLHLGKWHLGPKEFFPEYQGFDSTILATEYGNPRSYYPPYFHVPEVFADKNNRYLTDKLTDNAVNFIDTYDKNMPFMLSFWYHSVHGPLIGRTDLVDHFKAKGLTGYYAHYAAMVKSVDQSVGRVLDALKKKGIDQETIIIFLSDQGGAFENAPFRGGKSGGTALYEGGARVPFFFYWPGVTKPNTTNNSLVQLLDLFPTLVELTGDDLSNYEDIDGVSLLPTIIKNESIHRDAIYGYRGYEDLYASVRSGDWKLIAYRSGKLELYNLKDDIKEQVNLADEQSEIVEELVSKLVEWEKEMGVEEYSGIKKSNQ
jgi:arylsulfatase A-like enzyme